MSCVCSWASDQSSWCDGRLTIYGRQFARLRGRVDVDRRLATSTRRGGEPLNSVLRQPETDELYRLSPGFFTLHECTEKNSTRPPLAAAFHKGNYLNDWMSATRIEPAVDLSVLTSYSHY